MHALIVIHLVIIKQAVWHQSLAGQLLGSIRASKGCLQGPRVCSSPIAFAWRPSSLLPFALLVITKALPEWQLSHKDATKFRLAAIMLIVLLPHWPMCTTCALFVTVGAGLQHF